MKHHPATLATVDGVTPAPLTGFTVGVTGHRRWEEQAEMLSRRGARVVHGPTMATSLLGDLDETLAATNRVLDEPVDVVVLTTGIGTRSWFAAAESAGLDDALRASLTTARIVARGPKALHAARAEGLEVEWAAPGETNDEVVAKLVAGGLAGRRLVVQRDGGEAVVARALEAAGARAVIDVPVYRWHLPADPSPAVRLLESASRSQLDAVTFTSAHAVHNAFELAPDPAGLTAALGSDVLACAVGPVTARALRRHGVGPVVEPGRARLGSMVLELTRQLQGRGTLLALDGRTRRWQGSALIDERGEVTELAASELRLLRTLVGRAPAVLSKAVLVEAGADEHAVEAAVARLRAKLGPLGAGVRTVRRRGYACTLVCRKLTDASAAP